MLEWLRDLFRQDTEIPEVCDTCEAHKQHIDSLQLDISDLRIENRMLHEKLFQALRLDRVERRGFEQSRGAEQRLEGFENQGVENRRQQGAVKSWPRLKQELEKAHLKKPDDAKLEYWQNINKNLEAQAGLNSTSKQPSEEMNYRNDVEELAK